MSDLWARTTELVPVLPSSASSSSVAAASAVAATAHNDDDYFYDYGEEDPADFYELGEEEGPPSSFDRFPPSITTSRGGNYSRLAFDVGLWSVCPVAEGENSKTGRMGWSGMGFFCLGR